MVSIKNCTTESQRNFSHTLFDVVEFGEAAAKNGIAKYISQDVDSKTIAQQVQIKKMDPGSKQRKLYGVKLNAFIVSIVRRQCHCRAFDAIDAIIIFIRLLNGKQ